MELGYKVRDGLVLLAIIVSMVAACAFGLTGLLHWDGL